MNGGVEIKNDGECINIDNFKFHPKQKKITMGRKTMHVHFMDETDKIALISKISAEEFMKTTDTPDILHSLAMPAPLNKYVYPNPLYAIRFDGEHMEDMSSKEFCELCSVMSKESHRLAELQMAVYDVKPVFETQEEEEEISDVESCEAESDNDDEENNESENEWEFDDDDPPAE